MTSPGFDSREIFRPIVPVYDLLNRLLSGGLDRGWRRVAAREARGMRVLDLACGTGDLMVELLRTGRPAVVGADILPEMLSRVGGKIGAYAHRSGLVAAAGENLPFASGSFDTVTIAFGIRNFMDWRRGLRQMHRVLRGGGRIVILEFGLPKTTVVRSAYLAYFRGVLPLVGRVVSRDPRAYSYLPDSVLRWPTPESFLAELTSAGFREARETPLASGIVHLYVAEK